MGARRTAIAMDESQLSILDSLVSAGRFSSRDEALQAAVAELIAKLSHLRLAQESAMLDPAEEIRMAEEAFGEDAEGWPEY